jgi:hypothetical protein
LGAKDVQFTGRTVLGVSGGRGDFEVDSLCGSSGEAANACAPASKHTPSRMGSTCHALNIIPNQCYACHRCFAISGNGRGHAAVENGPDERVRTVSAVLTAGSSTGGRVASVALTWYVRISLADLVS